MFVLATPNLHPPTEVTPPVGAVPVETPKVNVSCEITPPQSIHYHLKTRNAIPSFTGWPHVCLYHSDPVIYKALPRFSPQNQQCSSKQDNIHFRWARQRYSITYIQCLWAISHYHSLPRTEKGMEIKACACFVPISLCLPCSENSWTAQIKERVSLAFCLGSVPGNLKWMSIVGMTKALVRESSMWATNDNS